MSDASKTPIKPSPVQACSRIASSIGKGLAVIAAVVAVYIVLMVVAFRVYVWLVTGEVFDTLLPIVGHP